MARSQPIASVVSGLLVAAVCAVVLLTTGETVQAERRVLAQIDAVGTRTITITDVRGDAGLTGEALGRVAGLSGVEWVFGLGPAEDGRNAALGAAGGPVAVLTLFGSMPGPVVIAGPAPPNGGLVGREALTALGMDVAAGGLVFSDGQGLPIVGVFDAPDDLAFLNRMVLAPSGPNPPPVRSIYIRLTDAELVDSATMALVAVLGATEASSLSVESPAEFARLRAAVSGELGRSGRLLILQVMGVGLFVAALNTYGAVTARRRDFGRRRALGARRAILVALVLAQTLVVALIGGVVGSLAGILAGVVFDRPTDPEFVVAVVILAVSSALVAALPPGVVAAFRDPVRVLRVP